MRKLAQATGRWLNSYIKSYGTSWIYRPPLILWPRRTMVHFLCTILAQIEEQNYQRARNTPAYRGVKKL